MRWLDKLERRFGRFAIKNLMTYIVALNLGVFLIGFLIPDSDIIMKLSLIPDLVLKGEVWRLITYIFIPQQTSVLWILFFLYLYYMIGTSLEHEWGSFKFNIYYFIGMLATTIVAFLTGMGGTGEYINLSLFLAFAAIYPNYEILIFFVLPVKIKYLAWLNWAYIGWSVLFSPLPIKIAAVVSVINYFIFFGKDIVFSMKNNRSAYFNRREFQSKLSKPDFRHRCTICGITENDDPNMDFRYCSKCEGDHEYCMNHLFNHEHITKNNS